MTIISKSAGTLGILSCIADMHKSAVFSSKNAAAKYETDAFLARSIGTQKADYVSARDASRKNWLLLNENFTIGAKKLWGTVSGYVKGFIQSGIRYIPSFIAGTCALALKDSKKANIAAGALGVIELWNFIKNSTGLFQKTDYLK